MTEKSRKRIYVAGALSADAVQYIKNLHTMILWADHIRREGYAVYVPGLDFLAGLQAGDWDYKDYFDNSMEWLRVSHGCFIVPGSGLSRGVTLESREAAKLKIPIFDKIADLNYYFKEKE